MSAHVASRLSAFLDRELTEAQAAEVRRHVADCEACAAHLRELEGADRAFAAMPTDPPASYFDSFAARVRGRIEKAPARRAEQARGPGGFRLPAWSWAIAAAVLLGVLLPRLPWDGGRPRSRAERESTAAAPAAAPPGPPATAEERFATPPDASAQAAATRRGDAAGRGRVEAPKPVPTVGLPPAVASADAKLRDAFARSNLEETAAAPSLSPRTPAAPEPQARKKDAELDLRRSISSEAKRDPGAYERLPTRDQEVADDKAAPAQETAALAKIEAEAVASVPDVAPAGHAAGTMATGRVQDKISGQAAGKELRAAGEGREMGAAAVAADPGGEAEFQELSARRPASLPERRLLREAWRAFLARNPDGPRVDEARVAVVTASVDIAVQSRDAADEAQARRDALRYLARPDAAQKDRVQDLLLRLEGSR